MIKLWSRCGEAVDKGHKAVDKLWTNSGDAVDNLW